MSKRNTSLFEVLSKEQKAGGKFTAPQWLANNANAAGQTPPAEPQTTAVKEPKSIQATSDAQVWVIRAGVGHLILAAAVLCLAVFTGFLWGRITASSTHTAEQQASLSPTQLDQVKTSPAQPQVLRLHDKQTAPQPPADSTQPTPADSARIDRVVGWNYLVIQVFSNINDARKAEAYVTNSGTGCSVVPLDGKHALLSAEGFDRKDKKEKNRSEQFKSYIRTLGRMYKEQKKAGYDFSTCYYDRWEGNNR